MIRHIFRRDWRELWPLVAIVTAVQVTNAALWFALGHFREPQGLVIVAQVFSLTIFLGLAVLITAAVQLDLLPGVSQDWLVRPISRRDLLCAKLLFVLAAAHAPMLLADLAHGTAAGFGLRDSLAAALSRNAQVLLFFSLPVLAIAAMTRTLVQVVAGMLAIWLTVTVAIIAGVLVRGGIAPPFAGSGMQWMTPAFWSVLALLAAVVIIPMQYFRRATLPGRSVAVAAVVLAPMLSLSTWAPAFAVQQWLSPAPDTAEPMTIAFDPGIGRSVALPASPSADVVLLPLRVSGLTAQSIVMNDRAEVRLVRGDGTMLYRARTVAGIGYGDDFPVQTAAGGDIETHQRVVFPDNVYELVRGQSVRMEIDYSLTLFHMEAARTISPVNGDERFAELGWCKTKIDQEGDDVELGCIKTGGAPMCVSVTLENPANGRRNPERHYCAPDYTPYPAHVYPDSTSQFGADLQFRDSDGLATYPVDGSQLADAQVVLKSYSPVAHFTRRLVIPEIRLEDWAAVEGDPQVLRGLP
ncbi:MAG TPA: hypothetical protein VE907_00475 [Gammaproteobacteria bacterium]|nr:hypothetical protein [Gammaproteobacteria bacterium]